MKLVNYLILALAALAFTACNSDSEPQTTYMDIVTLVSSDDQGSAMTFNEINDSPLVTLTTTQKFSKDNIGKRIVIMYSPVGTNEHAVSGAVDILFASLTLGAGAAPLPAVPDTLDNWASEPVDAMQIYRAGQYINIVATLQTATNPKKFQCYVDEATVNSEYPELHIVYKSVPGYDTQATNFFASYSIESLWNRLNVKGLKVIYGETSQDEVTIEKDNQNT